jgi:hypothetical protein
MQLQPASKTPRAALNAEGLCAQSGSKVSKLGASWKAVFNSSNVFKAAKCCLSVFAHTLQPLIALNIFFFVFDFLGCWNGEAFLQDEKFAVPYTKIVQTTAKACGNSRVRRVATFHLIAGASRRDPAKENDENVPGKRFVKPFDDGKLEHTHTTPSP